MDKKVAFDAIVWLLNASGNNDKLNVNLIGGEPLLRFNLIKELVPFAKRRSRYHGKSIHFSATTNCTLITNEIITFWKKWGMGFHCSIDGVPKIQNHNRPLCTGKESSFLVESGVKKILDVRPNVCARATIDPHNINLLENYQYFKSLGFKNIAFVCCDANVWDVNTLAHLEDEIRVLVLSWIDDIRKGKYIKLKYIVDLINNRVNCKNHRSTKMCGAGRGMVLVDTNGNLWPCHRWNKQQHYKWKLGSIYSSFSESARKTIDLQNQIEQLTPRCADCSASEICTGGCPAENLEITGSPFNVINLKCIIQRIWFRHADFAYNTLLNENRLSIFRKK